MKRWGILAVVFAVGAASFATPDISYSTNSGNWSYTASATSGEGSFSFIQPVDIENVQGLTTDQLVGTFLYIPDLAVSNLTEIPGTGIYTGTISPVSSQIAIKTAGGADVLVGNLTASGIVTVGTTATLYSFFDIDITLTALPNAIGSAFIDTLDVGDLMDFDLSLNGSQSTNMDVMIRKNIDNPSGSTFSGSMSVIPEPATLALLALGGLLVRRKES